MEDRSTTHSDKHPLRLLVVDDHTDIADNLACLFRRRAYEVRTAYTGEEAIACASEDAPDAIILDIGLPDIDGYEVAQQLRKQGVRAYLIALTGYGQDEDKKKAHKAGFDHHLTKPVGFQEIEQVLGHTSPV